MDSDPPMELAFHALLVDDCVTCKETPSLFVIRGFQLPTNTVFSDNYEGTNP